MKRIKPKGKYQAISVPTALLKDIKKYVKKSNYNSIAEFVKETVREKMNGVRNNSIGDCEFSFCPFCGKKLR